MISTVLPTPATEHRRLPASDQRCQQVDDFDAGKKDLASAALTFERRRGAVDGPMLDPPRERWTPIARLADCAEQPPKYRIANRCADWRTEGACSRAAP